MKEEKVEFCSEGQKVHGILYISDVENSPAIIVTHGYGGYIFADRFKHLTLELCKAGYTVLTLIFRGYDIKTGDKSKEDFKSLTLSGQISDLKAAIDFLYKKGYKKIGFTAECFGGIIALLLNDPRIKALAFWSIDIRNKASFEKLYGKKLIKELEEKGKSIYTSLTTGKKFDINKDFWTEIKNIGDVSESKIKEIKCPMLIVYGDSDKFFDGKVSEDLYKLANKPKKLILIKGANHIFSNPEHLKELSESIIDWFNKWLK